MCTSMISVQPHCLQEAGEWGCGEDVDYQSYIAAVGWLAEERILQTGLERGIKNHARASPQFCSMN